MRNPRKKENVKVLSSYATGSSWNIEGEVFTSDEAALMDKVQARYGLPMWVTAKLLRDVQGRQASELLSFDRRFQEMKLRFGEDKFEAAKTMIVAWLEGSNPTVSHSEEQQLRDAL